MATIDVGVRTRGDTIFMDNYAKNDGGTSSAAVTRATIVRLTVDAEQLVSTNISDAVAIVLAASTVAVVPSID